MSTLACPLVHPGRNCPHWFAFSSRKAQEGDAEAVATAISAAKVASTQARYGQGKGDASLGIPTPDGSGQWLPVDDCVPACVATCAPKCVKQEGKPDMCAEDCNTFCEWCRMMPKYSFFAPYSLRLSPTLTPFYSPIPRARTLSLTHTHTLSVSTSLSLDIAVE